MIQLEASSPSGGFEPEGNRRGTGRDGWRPGAAPVGVSTGGGEPDAGDRGRRRVVGSWRSRPGLAHTARGGAGPASPPAPGRRRRRPGRQFAGEGVDSDAGQAYALRCATRSSQCMGLCSIEGTACGPIRSGPVVPIGARRRRRGMPDAVAQAPTMLRPLADRWPIGATLGRRRLSAGGRAPAARQCHPRATGEAPKEATMKRPMDGTKSRGSLRAGRSSGRPRSARRPWR